MFDRWDRESLQHLVASEVKQPLDVSRGHQFELTDDESGSKRKVKEQDLLSLTNIHRRYSLERSNEIAFYYQERAHI